VLRVLAALVLCLAGAVRAEELTVGSPAPAWSLPCSDGRTWSLAEQLGKRGVVLAWFPKAFTPG
jgi:peroxiredoxin Q/BCP